LLYVRILCLLWLAEIKYVYIFLIRGRVPVLPTVESL